MNLWNELKRRSVFRVAAAYAVVGWLLVQLADILLGNFGAPAWVFQSFVALLVMGLPLALLLAWAYELTPGGMRRTEADAEAKTSSPQTGRRVDILIIIGLGAVIVLLIAERVWFDDDEAPGNAIAPVAESPAEDVLPALPAAELQQSIAVLPFADMSPGRDQEYFSDGITEEILATLARLGDLRVISRTSVMRYKGSDLGIPEIARELGVSTVLEGSVRRSGDRVRITAQLIDAHTDHHLWAETYDRTLSAESLFDIQSEIARHIADALHAEVTDAERERLELRPTEDLAAYDFYLRARQKHLIEKTERHEAIDLLHAALELDPEFALAEVALAQTHTVSFFVERTDYHANAARAAIERALGKAPQLPEAHAVNALMLGVYEGRPDASRDALERALELNPNNALVLWAASTFYRTVEGRLDVALAFAMRARMLDPVDQEPRIQIAAVYENAGAFDLARRWIRDMGGTQYRARLEFLLARLMLLDGELEAAGQQIDRWWEFAPRTAGMWRNRGEIELLRGRLDVAREAYEHEREMLVGQETEERVYTHLAWIYLRQGRQDLAEPLLNEAEEIARSWLNEERRPQPAPCVLAAVHAMRGDHERAVGYLERLHTPGFATCIDHGHDPRFRDLRDLTRYEALARRHDAELVRIRASLPMIEPATDETS